MQLNTEQELAANHGYGPCLVTACPGSGKTRTIVERTARLINSGVKPTALLCITFTNKASAEMRERIEKRIGFEAKAIFVTTFHKLCSTLLRSYGKPIGYTKYMSILDDDGQADLMAQASRQLGFEFTKPALKSILWNINDARENLENDDQIYQRFSKVDENYYNVAIEYLRRMQMGNQIDFSGLLSETVRLLSDESVLKAVQNTWTFFQVDEVQDTNYAQFKIVELLASHTKNVFVVGDLDQSIYGWRGARAENIKDFTKLYTGTKVISLGKNYRSTPEIVAVADKLIRHNEERIAAEFTTDNPSGSPVECKTYFDDREEAESVAKTIQNSVAAGRCSYKDIAIFYRINSMSRAIEMALIKHSVPHTLIGGFSFFDRKVVKDCLAMLKFLTNPYDGVAFHRFCNKPKRALGDVTVGKIEMYAETNKMSILDACTYMNFTAESVKEGLHDIVQAFTFEWQNKTIAESLTHILDKLKYKDFIEADKDTAVEYLDHLEEVMKDVARSGEENGQDIAAYLDKIALASNYDKTADGNSVSLMTLHASKGLEFPVVFMLGVEHDILPHKMAVADRVDGLEEERRLCYVGFTRAEKNLVISHCIRRQESLYAARGQVRFKSSRPSQFLIESGLVKKQVAVKNQIQAT